MFWSTERQYCIWPFEEKTELETAIFDAQSELFGDARVYLDVRALLGTPQAASDAPDAFLIDLSSRYLPVLYLVQIALASHEPLDHVARELLNFDLAGRRAPQRLRTVLRQAILKNPAALDDCEAYAVENSYSSLDHLVDELVHPDALRALVIMDAVEAELEQVLRGALRLPIEVMSFRRFRSTSGTEVLYDFEPFMEDVRVAAAKSSGSAEAPIDPSELDTIIISARKDHFESLFLGEHLWRPVRIHESFAAKIRFIAGYQVAPIAAITHVAEVDRIEPSEGPGKYVVYFKGPPQSLGPIQTATHGTPLKASETRYTSFARLCRAHSLEEVL